MPIECTYEDVPLPPPPSGFAVTPPIYRKMRRLGGAFRHTTNAVAEIFHVQAKLMENWREEYAWAGQCDQPRPTYETLSLDQLRGYFDW